MTGPDTRYLLICNTADGFMAQLNGVVIQLQLARRHGLEPIVYLHGRSYMFGGQNPYFEAGIGANVWTYYYEPIGPSGDALDELIRTGRVFTITTASELFRLFRWDPRSWFMYPFGYFRSVENRADGPYPSAWWATQRQRAGQFFDDGTIRFNAAIRGQVDRFVAENFASDTLGIQLRGSDKYDFGSGPNLGRKVPPDEYFPHIDRYLATHPEARIFVATDQRQWLRIMDQAYPGRILSFAEASLSEDDENRIHDGENKALRGVEVLVDALLLARCKHLLKCNAAVGEMALVVNPDMPFVDLNYETQPIAARNTVAHILLAPTIRILCRVWAALAEGGLSIAPVASLTDDRILVGSRRLRDLNVKTKHSEKAPRSPILSRRFVSDVFERAISTLAAGCITYADKPSRD